MSRKINFKLGDHVFIVGGTGSGKTTVAVEWIKALAIATGGRVPIHIVDSKIDGTFAPFEKKGLGIAYTENPPTANLDGSPFVIFRPEYDDKEMYNDYFEKIYRTREPAIIFIDELSSITGGTGHPPKYYSVLLKQGRSLNQSVITLNQMTRYIPLETLSQIMHIVVMNLQSEGDRKKLKDLIGDLANKEIPDKHGFWYRQTSEPIKSDKGKPYYYSDYNEFFFGGNK